MKLLLWNHKCVYCGTWFKAPHIPAQEYAYGEFLPRSENGEMRYVDADNGPVFDEVANMVDSHILTRRLDGNTRAGLFQAIFGVACDPDSIGCRFSLILHPRCPNCGGCKTTNYDLTSPHEFVEEEVQNISHEMWEKMTEEEKEKVIDMAIREAIERYGPNGPFE